MGQQELIRYAMKVLKITTRADFAERFCISKRVLDSWLLPDNSLGFRGIDFEVSEKIQRSVRDMELAQKNRMRLGTIDPDIPCIQCDSFNFRFPTLYRVYGHFYDLDEHPSHGDPVPDFVHDTVKRGARVDYPIYVLSKDTTADELGLYDITAIVPVAQRQGDDDGGWLMISEHSNLDRMDAYRRALLEKGDERVIDSVHTYWFESRIYTIYHMEKPARAAVDRVTIYTSDFYPLVTSGDAALARASEDCWSKVIGQDGSELRDLDNSPISSFDLYAE